MAQSTRCALTAHCSFSSVDRDGNINNIYINKTQFRMDLIEFKIYKVNSITTCCADRQTFILRLTGHAISNSFGIFPSLVLSSSCLSLLRSRKTALASIDHNKRRRVWWKGVWEGSRDYGISHSSSALHHIKWQLFTGASDIEIIVISQISQISSATKIVCGRPSSCTIPVFVDTLTAAYHDKFQCIHILESLNLSN